MTAGALDIEEHGPLDCEGRAFVLHGVEYEVGEQLGVGGEKVVYGLINRATGRDARVFKVFADPAYARAARLRTNAYTARLLCTDLSTFLKLTPVLQTEAFGGVFQIQSNMFRGSTISADLEARVDEAGDLARSDPRAALALYEQVLSASPRHDRALHNRAVVLGALGDKGAAWASMFAAFQAEPADDQHLTALITLALDVGRFMTARRLTDVFLERFYPGVLENDALFVDAYLAAGAPEEALSLIARRFEDADLAPPPHEDLSEVAPEALIHSYQSLHAAATKDLQKKLRALAMADEACRTRNEDLPATRALLELAASRYPRDAVIQANLGVVLRGAGEHEGAVQCFLAAGGFASHSQATYLANTAFTWLLLGDHEQAVPALEKVIEMVTDAGGDIPSADLPGFVTWFAEGMTEESPPSFIVQLLERCAPPRGTSLRRRTDALLEVYRAAAQELG